MRSFWISSASSRAGRFELEWVPPAELAARLGSGWKTVYRAGLSGFPCWYARRGVVPAATDGAVTIVDVERAKRLPGASWT